MIVYAGDSGWKHTEGQPTLVQRSPFAGRKEPLKYAGPRAWLRLKDPAYSLAPLRGTKIGNRPVFGIGVKAPNAPEEKCFFDKETGLLLKVEQIISAPQDRKLGTVRSSSGSIISRAWPLSRLQARLGPRTCPHRGAVPVFSKCM
jgi:hypothetical protein